MIPLYICLTIVLISGVELPMEVGPLLELGQGPEAGATCHVAVEWADFEAKQGVVWGMQESAHWW